MPSIKLSDIHTELLALAAGNEEYAYFNSKIINTKKTVLGVRVPDMRKLAKKLAKNVTPADIAEYIESLDTTVYEQTLLAGLLINCAKISDDEAVALAREYLDLTDNWAEIDIFAQKRKTFDEKLWWDFAIENLSSPHEFNVRYGVIEMMANFLNEKYIEKVFARLRTIRHEGYYVRMGMAWLYATAAVKFYERTLKEIKTAAIPIWTKKKALTKMLESYQFTATQKEEIRALRAVFPRT